MRSYDYDALALRGERELEIVRLSTPESLRPNHVLVKVLQNGICSGDVAKFGGRLAEPELPGHEFVGEVVFTGEYVAFPDVEFPFIDASQRVREGDLVTGWVRGGAAAEFVTSWDHTLRPLDEWQRARKFPFVLGEPMMCVVSAIRKARIEPGDHIVVIGFGFMNRILVALLSRWGLGSLTVAARSPQARQDALELGATYVIDLVNREQVTADVRALTEGAMADRAFEGTGAAGPVDLASYTVRPSGKLSLISFHDSEPITVDFGHIEMMAQCMTEGHTRNLFEIDWAFERARRLAGANTIDLDDQVTHVGGLHDAVELFRAGADRDPGFIKACLDFGWQPC